MNILFTITAYPPSIGGAQISTHELAKSFSLHNDVKVISFWNTNRTDWLFGTTLRTPSVPNTYSIDLILVEQLGFSIKEKLRIAAPTFSYYFLMGWGIDQLANTIYSHLETEKNIDIINNVRIGREPLSFASLQYARKKNIPFVFTPLHHPRWSGWLYRYYHQLYREADLLIALTESEKKKLVELGADDRRVIVTGIGPILAATGDGTQFRNSHSLGQNPVVLFLGQKYPYKGVSALVDAAPLVWKKFPETRFVFIRPRTKYSDKLFKELSDHRILELGSVSLQEKTDALDACTLLCLPSTQESFGGVYTEAWSFRKPVIGCSIPAVKDVISNNVDGLLVDQSPDQIADGILQLIPNPVFAQSMGDAGYKKVQVDFSWASIAAKTEHVYQQVVTGI